VSMMTEHKDGVGRLIIVCRSCRNRATVECAETLAEQNHWAEESARRSWFRPRLQRPLLPEAGRPRTFRRENPQATVWPQIFGTVNHASKMTWCGVR